MPDAVLHKTESVCPVCLQKIDAFYKEVGGEVWLQKTCDAHGGFSVPVWDNAHDFLSWKNRNLAQPPTSATRETEKGCPYDCGICTAHEQASCCVLLEVTQRCNLACPVCFAASGGEDACEKQHDPSLATILSWYKMLLAKGGPFNIQLSGGEPTMRDDLGEIIKLGREMGFSFFQLNTNGLRLAKQEGYAKTLQEAGLSTVFLQFDSLQPEANIRLRGANLLQEKKQAIANCGKAGLGVVLVPTVAPDCNDDELADILDFAAGQVPVVRGVHFQPISYFGRYGDLPQTKNRLTIPKLLQRIEAQSGGKLLAEDFLPAGAEHALCSFHRDYFVQGGKWSAQPIAEKNTACCENNIPSSTLARKSVALKWSLPKALPKLKLPLQSYDFSALDDFLEAKTQHSLAVSGMAFQDAWTVDLQRLKRCHIHVVAADETLVPFCAYNLTSTKGKGLHRR